MLLCLDEFWEISSAAKLHDDEELVILVEVLDVADNTIMPALFQEVYLIPSFPHIFFTAADLREYFFIQSKNQSLKFILLQTSKYLSGFAQSISNWM